MVNRQPTKHLFHNSKKSKSSKNAWFMVCDTIDASEIRRTPVKLGSAYPTIYTRGLINSRWFRRFLKPSTVAVGSTSEAESSWIPKANSGRTRARSLRWRSSSHGANAKMVPSHYCGSCGTGDERDVRPGDRTSHIFRTVVEFGWSRTKIIWHFREAGGCSGIIHIWCVTHQGPPWHALSRWVRWVFPSGFLAQSSEIYLISPTWT